MKRRRQPKMTAAAFQRFKQTLQAAKADERRQAHGDAVIYHDALMRTLLVVQHAGGLWLVPRRPGGWSARSAVTMTAAARSERLTVARDVATDWLGIPAENRPPDCPRPNAGGAT